MAAKRVEVARVVRATGRNRVLSLAQKGNSMDWESAAFSGLDALILWPRKYLISLEGHRFASYCEPISYLRSCLCSTAIQSHSVVDLRFLENKFQRELQCTRRVVRVGNDDSTESCTLNRVGCGGIILIVSDKVARCIRQIEGLRAKLQLNPFRQREILEDGKIKMPEGRAIQAVT